MRARSNKNAGFTLLEIVLVMVVIMVIAGMVAPRLLGFAHGRDASNFADQMESLARYARQQAVAQSCTIVLNIDSKAGTYWLSREDGPSGSPVASAIDSQWGTKQQVPGGIVFSWTNGDTNAPNNAGTPSDAVRFYADGRIDIGTLTVRSSDATILLDCRAATESYRIVKAGA